MASESEAWWRFRYSQYSIKDLQKLPVYHRFLQLHYPYERINSQRSERYTVSEAVDEFEWKEEGRLERFAHRKEGEQYQYTCNFQERKCAVTVESWKEGEKDWGSVTKHFEGWTLVEGWKVQPTERIYERFVEERGIKRGMRCGVKECGERWVEEIWTQEGEKTVKKSWERPSDSGGESHTTQGNYEWGEQWTSDSVSRSQKCWHQEGAHTWGSAQGQHGRDETWEHQWDCDTACKLDQKVLYRAGRAQGYRYRGKGQDWSKEEWEGLEPEQDQRSLQFAGRVSRLLEREYAGALASNRTLKLFPLQSQAKTEQIADIERNLGNLRLPPSDEVPTSLTQLEELRTLQDQQESLKQSLWEAHNTSTHLLSLYPSALKATATESLATLQALAVGLHSVQLDTEVERVRGEIRAVEDLEEGGKQVEAWQFLLHSLEVLKRNYIPLLQKQALGTDSEPEHSIRSAHLPKVMKDLQELVEKQHNLAVALSTAVGDEEKAATIEGLRIVSDEISSDFNADPGEESLSRLLSTGKVLGSIGMELTEELVQGAGWKVAETAEACERISAEVLPQLDLLTRDLMEASGEAGWEEALQAEPVSLSRGVNSVQKRLKTARGLANRLKSKGTDQLDQATAPHSTFVPHSPLKAELGASEEAVVSQAMQLLEPAQEELNDLALTLSERNSGLETQLDNLHNEASSGFHDYRQTHKVAFLYRSITGLRAYFPLLKAMLSTTTSPMPGENTLTNVWSELQYSLADMNDALKAMAEGQSDLTGKVTALEAQGLKLAATQPSSSDLLQALRLLRTAQATLRELGDRSSLRTGLEALKSALAATHRDAEGQVAGSSELQGELAGLESPVVAFTEESRAWPREDHFAFGLSLLRDYIPYFLSAAGKAARPAVNRLKTAVRYWTLEIADRDLAGKLQGKCEEITQLADEYTKSQQPNVSAFLQRLEEYFLLLRTLPIGQTAKDEKGVTEAMKELEAFQVDLTSQIQQLSSQDPSLTPQAKVLGDQFNVHLAACKKHPSNSHVAKAASTLRGYLPLLQVNARTQSVPENLTLAPQELLPTLRTVLRDLDLLGLELAEGEPVPTLQALKEASTAALQKSPGTASVLETLGVVKAFAVPLRSLAKKAGCRRAMKVVEQTLDEAHSVAEDLVSEHPDLRRDMLALREKATSVLKEHQQKPKYQHIRKGLTALSAYYPFFCRHSWTAGVNAMRPMLEEIHNTGLDLSDGNESARNQLVALHRDALVTFQVPTTSERSPWPTAIRGLRAYFPVLNALIKSALRNPNLQVATDEAMRGLFQAATELDSLGRLLGGKEALSRSRLRTLAESAAVPFREYHKQPQTKHIPRAVTALLPYFPAFRDFLKQHKSPSIDRKIAENDTTSLGTIWETARSHAEEMRGLAQTLAEDDPSYLPRLQSLAKGVFKPFNAAPSLSNLHAALTALRGYHPELLQLSRTSGLKAAMDLLRTHIEETHKEAVSDTTTESGTEEVLAKLHSEALAPFQGFGKAPRAEHLQQAVAAFRRYHPFFRHFARKIALRLLEPLANDLHTLSRELAIESREKEQLAALRKAAKAPFSEKEPKEGHLRQAVTALQAYAPFLSTLIKAKSGVPMSAIEQAMKALEPHQSDMADMAKSLLGTQTFDPRLIALQDSVSMPFKEFQQSPAFPHLPRAIAALRGYYPLLKAALSDIHEQSSQASAAGLEAALAALEPTTVELAELSRDLTVGDDSLEAQLRALREAAEAPFKANRVTPQSSENLLRAIKAVRDYHAAMKDWTRKGGFRWVMDLIERTVTDTHKEAVALASNDQVLATELQQLESDSQAPFREFRVTPRRGQAVQGMQALRAYHPFFRQYSWRFALKHLEGLLAGVHQVVEECVGDQTHLDSLPALRRQAMKPLAEHRETPQLVHIQQAISAVSAYFPLFRGLRSGSAPTSAEARGPHFSVTEAMEQLEPALTELDALVQVLTPAPAYQPRVTSLRDEGLQPFTEYRRSPQYSLLPRAIGAVRAYHPLLLELLKKAKSSYEDTDQGSDEIMKELESIAADLSKLAEELNDGDPELDSILTLLRDSTEAQFRENRRVSKRGNVLKAAKTLRAYRSLLLDLGKKVGLQAALDLLKPVLLDTHQEAIEHVAGAEEEYLSELAQLEKDGKAPFKEPRRVSRRVSFQQGLKALRAYHPFFRRYWWRSTLALLEPTLPEFDRILVSCHPACEPKLTLLREKSNKLFRRYRSNYNPSLLPLSIELLRTYHRVLHSTQQATPETETISLPAEVVILEASAAQVEQAETLLGAERQEAVNSNVLIETLSKANVPADRPLTYLNIFKFFEELMDRKFEVDAQDLQAGRKPRAMTEFLMEHLNRQFGIKSLALRYLGQLIPGLQILYNENLPYAVLFARLLQVWHPEPIPFQLALYLVRIRMDFHKLMEKYAREREVQRKRQKGKKLETTYGRAAYDQAATGGEAFTTEVISLIYDLFENDEKSGELALQLLRPEGCSLVDYVTFKLCHKMAKLGMSAEAVFKLIDEDGGGSISEAEFVSGIKSSLELWITEADIKEVYQELAKGGELTLQDFTESCNFSWFLKVEKSEEFTNTKCHFLTVLITLFNRKQRDSTAQLIALYDSKQEVPLSKESFTVLLRSLDAEIPQERVNMIWICGCEEGQSGEGLTETAFVWCMLKYPTGPFSKTTFCKD